MTGLVGVGRDGLTFTDDGRAAPLATAHRPDGADSRRDYVKGVLDDALVIVAELGVPTDLAPVALAKAIDLLASAAR